MLVTLQRTDNRYSRVGSPTSNPVVRAVRRALGVTVTHRNYGRSPVQLVSPYLLIRSYRVELPPEALKLVARAEAGLPLSPVTFELRLPRELSFLEAG